MRRCSSFLPALSCARTQCGCFPGRTIVFPSTAGSWLGDYEIELFRFPDCRYGDQVDSPSQGLAYEISCTEFFGTGYSNFIEGLMFDRYFSGGRW